MNEDKSETFRELIRSDIKQGGIRDKRIVTDNISEPFKKSKKPEPTKVYIGSIGIYISFAIISFLFIIFDGFQIYMFDIPDDVLGVIFNWYGIITLLTIILSIEYSLGLKNGIISKISSLKTIISG